ncbi:MAG: ComEC/Rec2 family competence protein [Bacteroidales bacterium]|nr:ComEC/Rec2 family competence protein [Bacteroidales bacterium]
MINWFKYPFIRLLIPLAIGIGAGFLLPAWFNWQTVRMLLVSIIALVVVLFVVASAVKDYRYRWVFGLILNLHLILLGVLTVHIRSEDVPEDGDVWVARLAECPAEKDKSVKVVLKLLSESGSVMTYFEKSERSLSLKYGDVIVFFEPPKLVEPPKNPEQFDYRTYLARKGVSRQVYLKDTSWEPLGVNKANPIYGFSYRLRDFLLMTMRNLGIGGDEYAVAAAILLGYDDTLPGELRQRYVAAGSMHILCVSGMHVGVIFMVFSNMLAFLNRRKRWQNIAKQSLLLLLIWFYAFLAGLAPSILRSTIMLSFVILGDMLQRKGVLLNSLAASAFILLCMEPSNLFNVGFLLSYAAVVGIVELQQPINRMIYSKYKLPEKMWELTSVTLAAQIVTAPFSIYYFHQFPTYFWLSNLFMGPVSTVVIIGGMIMLLLCYVPWLNMAVAWIVKWLVFVMNFIVSWVESLPMSILKGLYINDLEFICLITAIALLMFALEHRKKRIVYAIMATLLLFSISQFTRALQQRDRVNFTVYSVNKGTAVDFVCGNSHLLLCDTTLIEDQSAVSFNIENNWVREGVYNDGAVCLLDSLGIENQYLKKLGDMVSFGGKTIGFYNKSRLSTKLLPYRPHLDYYLVRGTDYFDIECMQNNYEVDLLVLDCSVPTYLSRKIVAKAEEIGQKYYDIRTEGALVVEIN